MSVAGERPRAVYLTDTMADVRNIEAVASAFDVTLLAPGFLSDDKLTNYWPPRTAHDVQRVRLPGGRAGFILRAALWLRRSRHAVDVVYVLDNLTAALAASLARRLGGPPVVIQVGRPTAEYFAMKRALDGPIRNAGRRLLGGALIAFNERTADGIGAVSDYCAAQCAARNDNVASIPWCGVDTEVFSPRWTREDARRHLDLPLDRPVVMLRSRIAPEKDPETFLRAIDALRDQGRDVCAVYMGGELAEMAEVMDREGVEVIARKPASLEEIPMWYVAADVDVQTSHAEGLGVSPLESLACGTPVVVTDVGGLPEVVDGGRVGQLVPRGDAVALARAIATYLDDTDLAATHAREGRSWVQQRFSQQRTWTAWGDLGRSVMARRPSTGGPTRVLFVDHETRLSGGELDLVDLVAALDHDRLELLVALPAPGPLEQALRALGVEVRFVPMGESLRHVSRWELTRSPLVTLRHLVAFAGAAVNIARVVRQVRPDVVHTNSMKSHLLAIPAVVLTRTPLVWHLRDILHVGWLARVFARLAARVPACVVCISHAVEAPLARAASRGRTAVVYNGIHPAKPSEDEVATMRERLSGSPPGPLVGIVGQIAHWKGQDVVIEAAAQLVAGHPTLRVAIVGACLFPENEREFEERVRARSVGAALAGHVVWTGAVTPIEPVMAALDVLVHASRLPEPFGRVIIEAMAQGTPVITTSIGAGPELVTARTGRLVPPDDPSALATAIHELLEACGSSGGRAALAAACRERAAEFHTDATATGVMRVYADLRLMASDGPPSPRS